MQRERAASICFQRGLEAAPVVERVAQMSMAVDKVGMERDELFQRAEIAFLGEGAASAPLKEIVKRRHGSVVCGRVDEDADVLLHLEGKGHGVSLRTVGDQPGREYNDWGTPWKHEAGFLPTRHGVRWAVGRPAETSIADRANPCAGLSHG